MAKTTIQYDEYAMSQSILFACDQRLCLLKRNKIRFRKGTSIRQVPISAPQALRKIKPWDIIWMNDL